MTILRQNGHMKIGMSMTGLGLDVRTSESEFKIQSEFNPTDHMRTFEFDFNRIRMELDLNRSKRIRVHD